MSAVEAPGVSSLKLMPSRTPDALWRSAARIDPVFDGLFTVSSTAVWDSRATLDRKRMAGLVGRVPAMLQADVAESWASLQPGSMWWQRLLDVLGALTQWCTMTTEQIAACTGHPIAGVRRTLSTLFATGLVESGLTVHPVMSTRVLLDRAVLWRPGRERKPLRRLTAMLTTAERLSVTGGRLVEQVHQYDRHNVLTAELALRLAEFTPVGTVLGDTLSDVRSLTALDGRDVPANREHMQADMTVVRPDGLRIAVEMTVNFSEGFRRKARNWASLLAQHPLRESGLVVLFVVGRRINTTCHSLMGLERGVRRAVREAALEFRGPEADPTRARMAVARWDDFFPAAGAVHACALTGLRAVTATGNLALGDDAWWEPRDLLDPASVPFVPADPIAPLAVIENARAIRGTPRWLRSGPRPSIASDLLAGGGFGAGVPMLSTTVRGGIRLQADQRPGAAGEASVPARLEL